MSLYGEENMKCINLVYGDDYEDVDILSVPDEIVENIDKIMWDFFDWTEVPENKQQLLVKDVKGNNVLGIDTEEFLYWLNNIKITDGPKAVVIKQHTSMCPEYPVAEF